MSKTVSREIRLASRPNGIPTADNFALALDELKSSAETGSETVMKTRFKEFDEALKQLEEQMKKQ